MRCTASWRGCCATRHRATLQVLCILVAVTAYCLVLGSYAVANFRAADVHFSLSYVNVTPDEVRLQDSLPPWEEEGYNYDPGYLEEEMEVRRERVWRVCVEKGLHENGKPNAWEFLIDINHHIIWCSIFKAASSTWMYNFNILGGYKDSFLRRTKKTPVSLARARFPRPSVQQLQESLPNSLSFLIVREPFERLLSAYRNKIEGAKNVYYRKLARQIASRYRRSHTLRDVVLGPTFPEFVEYVIDSHHYDEHWAPYHSFCTPCQVNFTVVAKMETLDRDEEYIIHKAGLQHLLLPSHYHNKPKKVVNKARDGIETSKLLESYYSQLTQRQMRALYGVYGTDFEMFGYNITKYFSMVQLKKEY